MLFRSYASSESIYYSAYTRLISKKQPSYQCGMSPSGTIYSDASESDKFKEGVGLMTADEVAMAGGIYESGAPNTYYYRNSVSNCSTAANCSVTGSNYWWTMSPREFNGVIAYAFGVLGSAGSLHYAATSGTYMVRPVISLKSNTLVSGSGTASDPYLVEGI